MKAENFVFFISSLGSGGAERQLTFLSNFLVSKGHSVEINVLSDESTEPFYDLDSRVSYKPLSLKLKTSNKFSRLFFIVKRIFVFSSIMRKAPKDTVFLSFMDVMNLICIVASLLALRKINVAERSDPHHQPVSRSVRKTIDFFYRFAHKIFVQSETAKDYFRAHKAKVHVVYNAFDFNKINNLDTIHKNGGVLECISVARLSSEKGVPFLVDLFLKIEQNSVAPKVKLRVFGQGVLSAQIEEKIKNSKIVTYHGPSRDIYTEMMKSDLLLLASDYEGFPNVVLEALALGTSVLSTATAGAKQIKTVYKSDSLMICEKTKFSQILKGAVKVASVNDEGRSKLMNNFGVEFVMSQWEAGLLSD